MTDDNHRPTTAGTASGSAKTYDIGTLVVDEARKRMGVVMDHVGARLQIRPPRGGREWDADPVYVRPAREDEILRVHVATVPGAAPGRTR